MGCTSTETAFFFKVLSGLSRLSAAWTSCSITVRWSTRQYVCWTSATRASARTWWVWESMRVCNCPWTHGDSHPFWWVSMVSGIKNKVTEAFILTVIAVLLGVRSWQVMYETWRWDVRIADWGITTNWMTRGWFHSTSQWWYANSSDMIYFLRVN